MPACSPVVFKLVLGIGKGFLLHGVSDELTAFII